MKLLAQRYIVKFIIGTPANLTVVKELLLFKNRVQICFCFMSARLFHTSLLFMKHSLCILILIHFPNCCSFQFISFFINCLLEQFITGFRNSCIFIYYIMFCHKNSYHVIISTLRVTFGIFLWFFLPACI